MRPLYLTYNPSAVGTTRIVRDWLIAGRQDAMEGSVCVTARGDLTDWLQAEAFSWVTCPMEWPDKRRPWRFLLQSRKLRKWIVSSRIDVIHCNEHQSYPFAAALAKATGLPVVCHVRCKLTSGFAGWAFRKHEPDALIWCTEHMASECAAALEGTIQSARQHIIPLGIDLDTLQCNSDSRGIWRRKLDVKDDQVIVGMTCFVRPGKRIEDFLLLAHKFEDSDAVFVLAGGPAKGDEDYFTTLRPKIEQAVADGRIVWLGHVEPVEPLLTAFDIFVSTSEHESFGMSVCEAMACQVPILAYRGGSVAEVVGDAGMIVENGDLSGLTKCLKRLIDDRHLRNSLGLAARQRVATKFNPTTGLQTLVGVYQSLLRDKCE